MKSFIVPCLLCLTLGFMGCAAGHEQVMATSQSQVKLRSIQSRYFETNDKMTTLRTVIATLQDLGFIVTKADDVLGTVSATKLATAQDQTGYSLRITISVFPRGKERMVVRANAQYMKYAVEDPKPYQQFFQALEKSMFLTAHNID